jgi:hypothetical protein
LGRLATADSIRVQRHLLNCATCLRRLVEVEVLLAEVERIAGSRRPTPNLRKPLFIVHDTADGFIYSRAERRGRKWYAKHWGEQLDGGRECKSLSEANQFLVESFQQMFPEHRCTDRCQVNPGIKG